MYKSHLKKFIITLGIFTFVYILFVFQMGHKNVFGIVYIISIFLLLFLINIYISTYVNEHIRKNYKYLYDRYKEIVKSDFIYCKEYDNIFNFIDRHPLALYIWRDIRAGAIKECSNDLKNVAKDGIGCLVFCIICFAAVFVNFLFMGVNL